MKRKPNLCPFYNEDDERLKWLEETLLKYLDDWQKSVEMNKEIPEGSKKYCLLPDQTVEGLKICGMYTPVCVVNIKNILLLF